MSHRLADLPIISGLMTEREMLVTLNAAFYKPLSESLEKEWMEWLGKYAARVKVSRCTRKENVCGHLFGGMLKAVAWQVCRIEQLWLFTSTYKRLFLQIAAQAKFGTVSVLQACDRRRVDAVLLQGNWRCSGDAGKCGV